MFSSSNTSGDPIKNFNTLSFLIIWSVGKEGVGGCEQSGLSDFNEKMKIHNNVVSFVF